VAPRRKGELLAFFLVALHVYSDFVRCRAYQRAARDWVLEELIPGTQVAARVARSHDLWILGIVVRYVEEIDSYEVEDEDEESDGRCVWRLYSYGLSPTPHLCTNRRHVLQPQFVEPLPKLIDDEDPLSLVEGWKELTTGSRVLSMYPNTTSFYMATVQSSERQVRPTAPELVFVCHHQS
jgi:hypothetical protein